MVAAALTLWLLFGLYVASPFLGLARGVARTAAGLLLAELSTLLAWSYGCEFECTSLATIAGVAARTDIPVLAAVFAGAVLARRVRAAFS